MNTEVLQKDKQTMSIKTISGGILIMFIPITIAICANNPEVIEMLKQSKSEILKSAAIGVSILPVFLFATIKGGQDWYKDKKVWALIGAAVIIVMGIVLTAPISDPVPAIGELPFY